MVSFGCDDYVQQEGILVNEQEFIKKMVDIMDTEDDITMDTRLEEIEEWDSLSYLAFLAMCTAGSDRKIDVSDVKQADTIRDLYRLYTRM